jgi:hypothetical protein
MQENALKTYRLYYTTLLYSIVCASSPTRFRESVRPCSSDLAELIWEKKSGQPTAEKNCETISGHPAAEQD